MRWAVGGLLAGLLLGIGGGIYVDQQWPDQVPYLARGSSAGHLDLVTYGQAVRLLQADYYYRNLDYNKLSQGSLKGLIQALGDPFSQYLTPSEYRSQRQSYAGNYSGIGIYVSFKGTYPVITGVISGSPAEKAGLRAADQITAIDGKPTKGRQASDLSAAIQGPDGSTVTLAILRGTQTLTVPVKRGKITVPFVRSTKLAGGILYLRIYSFGDGTAAELATQLKAGLPGSKGVILDLRDNPGGFIDAAQSVISDFVASGEAFELRDRTGTVDRHNVGGEHIATTVPIQVLVNANSASASEIVAGSLRVHQRAKLVGQKTYGKGSVQEDFQLPDGGDLHLTIRRWFLPDGSSVQGVGLKPDYEVALPSPDAEFNVEDPAAGYAADTQLNRALSLLTAPS